MLTSTLALPQDCTTLSSLSRLRPAAAYCLQQERNVRYQSGCRQVQLRDQSFIPGLGQEAMLLRADVMGCNEFTHVHARITLTLVPETQAPSGRGAR